MTIHVYLDTDEDDELTGGYVAQWEYSCDAGRFTQRCAVPNQLVYDDREILWAVVRAGCQPTRDFTIERHF